MPDLPRLPARPADGHKGTFGTVCVLGGQADAPRVMLGGPALAALAALRSGAGLAVLAVPRPLMTAALTVAPGATGLALPVDKRGRLVPSDVAEVLDAHLAQIDCLAIGPGLGADEPQQKIVARLAGLPHPPMVIDADGLNALSSLPDFHRDLTARAVLTPHPGEFKRLAAALGLKADPVTPAARPDAAAQLAQRLGCVVVLKGAGTVISDGISTHVNTTGNVALATAGTGDVLTGLLAGLIAQFGRTEPGRQPELSLLACARLAVHIHGAAADHWAAGHGNAGMLATDLLEEIPAARKSLASLAHFRHSRDRTV